MRRTMVNTEHRLSWSLLVPNILFLWGSCDDYDVLCAFVSVSACVGVSIMVTELFNFLSVYMFASDHLFSYIEHYRG